MRKITTGKFIITGIAIIAAIAMTGCSKKTENVPDADMTVISLSEIESRGEASGEDAVSTEAEETDEVNSVHSIAEMSASVKETATDPTSTEAQNITEAETTAEETTTVEETTTAEETTTEIPAVTETQPETTTLVEITTEVSVTTEAPATQPETTTQAHVHSYTPYVSSYPTCTTEGVMTSTCHCGDSYTEPISATGHSFGAYVYNNDATYEADGTETAICSVCGVKDTRTAAATKLVQETTTAELQSYFDWMKENLNPYGLECMYAQEGFTETFPFVDATCLSSGQYFVYFLEGGDASPADEFRSTHNMSVWREQTFCMGEYKEGIVWFTCFGKDF